jgi:dihydroneopterin aldolase
MGVLFVKRFPLKCVIGAFDRERKSKRTVYITLSLESDMRKACRTDRLANALDYSQVLKNIRREAVSARCRLIETLADRIADVCLWEKSVQKAIVTVEKKGAFGVSVAARIEKRRPQHKRPRAKIG